MSETYRVSMTNIGGAIYCGNRPVLFTFNNPQMVADVLNRETAPIIAALEEKALENMRLNEEIEGLQARLESINNEAYDALHSLHYGVIEKPTLQKVFSIIHTESKIEKKDGE